VDQNDIFDAHVLIQYAEALLQDTSCLTCA